MDDCESENVPTCACRDLFNLLLPLLFLPQLQLNLITATNDKQSFGAVTGPVSIEDSRL